MLPADLATTKVLVKLCMSPWCPSHSMRSKAGEIPVMSYKPRHSSCSLLLSPDTPQMVTSMEFTLSADARAINADVAGGSWFFIHGP